jgi:hypothetical protein
MPGTQVEPYPGNLPVHVPGMPLRKRESEALPARLLRSARRNKAVSVPLAVPLPVWTAAEIMHAYGLGPEAAAAGAVGGAVVWLFAPHKWDRAAEVWYARATAAALAGWESAVAFAGGASLPAATSLILLSAAWGIPWYRHYRIRGMKGREKTLKQWEAWWAYWSFQWGLGHSRVIDAADDDITVRLRLQLWAGHQTGDDVRGKIRNIESALQDFAAAGGVRVQDVGCNKSQADLFFKRENPLAAPVGWDDKHAPRSVLDPWYPGMTETGRWRPMRQTESMFTIGQKESGKSTLLLGRLLSLAGCADATSVLIDLKGGRSARPVLETGAADYVVTELPEAEMVMLLGEAEILARMEGCYDGNEQITPTPLTPALFLHADEVHRLTSANRGSAQAAASMEVIATTGRSAAVYPDVITQYGALDASVRSEATRMNLGLRFVFRMPRADMASFAINEYGRLDVSKLEEAGECYANDNKAATEEEKLRAVNLTHDAFRELAPARITARGPKPPLKLWCGNHPCPAGGTWQEWWDSRWARLPKAFREISPQYREWAQEHGEPEPAAPAPARIPVSSSQEPDRESGAAVAARIAAQTAEPDIAPSPSAAARAADITARNTERFFALLATASPGGARAADLAAGSGMSQAWAYGTLGRLLERGAVMQPRRGLYAPVPGRDARAEAMAVKAGDDALRRDAETRLRLVRPAG